MAFVPNLNRSLLFVFFLFFHPSYVSSQTKIKATGTGNTTGHIANLSVSNTGKETIYIPAQSVFIPSSGQYQPYVGFIPETPIPSGTTIIPVDGFCADVHTPPVPTGNPMPPLDEWVPVGDPSMPVPDNHIPAVPGTPVSPFEPADIPGITSSPHFTPVSPGPETPIIITWPGTDIPVGGVFGTGMETTTQAKVLVKVIEEIAQAFDVIQKEHNYPTPFSGDPEKEREAVIQQTFWIYTSLMAGKKYAREDFTQKVYEQFSEQTGVSVAGVPEQQKKDIDQGVNQFWNSFTAVGVEAKVLSKGTASTFTPGNVPGETPPVPGTIAIDDANCGCGDASIRIITGYKGRFEKKEQGSLYNYLDINKPRDTVRLWPDKGDIVIVYAKPDDELSVVVDQFEPKCLPCKTGNCDPINKKLEIKMEGTDTYAAYTEISVDAQKGNYQAATAAVKPLDPKAKPALKPEENPVRIYFKLTWDCIDPAGKCKKKSCEQKYELVVPRFTDAPKPEKADKKPGKKQ